MVACALAVARHAHQHQVSSTLVIDDYIDRAQYHAVESVLGSPQMVGRAAVFEVGAQAVPAGALERYALDPA